MEISQLRSLLCVAENGSVSRAAEKVHLTQPSVTKQIQALEREFKTPLFDRTGRGVELTAAGAVLCGYARRSLALLDECQQVIADMEVGAIGEVVIGAGTTTSIFQLPTWIRLLKATLPQIDVVVRTGNSQEIVDLALQREVELGLVTTSVRHPDLHVTPLFEEEIVFVAAPIADVQPSNQRQTLSPASFPCSLILFPQSSGFRQYLDQMLISVGLELPVKMEMDSLEAIKALVAAGIGASFLPASAVAVELEAKTLRRVHIEGLPKLQRGTSVIWRTDRHLGAGAQALIEILTAEL